MIAHDIVWVKLTDNRAYPLHVESFRAIRRQQMEQQGVPQAEQSDDQEIEVDSDRLAPNPSYRIWKGITIIGTFYQVTCRRQVVSFHNVRAGLYPLQHIGLRALAVAT